MQRVKTLLNMRGIIVKKFGGIEEMVLSDSLPIPEFGDNQVLMKVKCSGVNPVDTYIRAGNFSSAPTLPYTPGKDGAGIIENIGKNVEKYKKGDRVFCCSRNLQMGTLAEYIALDNSDVFPLDSRLSFEEGSALAVPYFTAHRALFFKGGAKKGSRVLVHGASGAVGLAAVQMAKANDMTVVGTAGTLEGIELVKGNGADSVYNHRAKNYMQQIEKDFEEFDVVLEMLANVNLQTDMTLMARGGTTVVIGCRGDITINPRLLMYPETSIVGCALMVSNPEEWKITAESVMEGIHDGWVKPVISKVYPLEKAGEAHHDVIHNKGTTGKLVVKIED